MAPLNSAFSNYALKKLQIYSHCIFMPTAFILVKVLVSAILIVAISEIAKRNTAFAALIASLPLLSILAVLWMVAEGSGGSNNARIASHMEATFWYVLPSLPMFLLVPAMLRHEFSFAVSLLAGIVLTAALYVGVRRLAAVFGVAL